jgi:hypothetical protein
MCFPMSHVFEMNLAMNSLLKTNVTTHSSFGVACINVFATPY